MAPGLGPYGCHTTAERVADRPSFQIVARIILSNMMSWHGRAVLGRFGDKPLAGVGNALLASMRSERTLCLLQLAKDRNQFVQLGRFVANPAVTTQEMLASTARLTDLRAAGRHVLAIMSLPRPPPGGGRGHHRAAGHRPRSSRPRWRRCASSTPACWAAP